MVKRDPITVSESAGSYISGMLAREPGKALRVSVNNKGCAGHKYEYALVELDQIDPQDDIIVGDWGTIVLDKTSILYLIGSKLELSISAFQQQLTWDNPMAQSACGCGESFSIKGNVCSEKS